MPRGQVKVLKLDKGYGFIAVEDAGDIFFHATGLDYRLSFDATLNGRIVEFQIQESSKGPTAVRIIPAW